MDQVPVYFLLSLPIVGALAMFALGIVVIHQSSRVLNLAHGAMAMVPAYAAFALSESGVPAGVAVAAGVVCGALLGVAVERVFVRSLRAQGATAQTVGTIAALGLMLAFAIKVWGTTPRIALSVFPSEGFRVGASTIRWGHVGLIGVAVAAAAAFFWMFRGTDIGLAMRGAADNRRGASLQGVDPDRTTVFAWAIGGALAALAGILLAAVTVLHPVNLTLLVLPAFVAALIGGLGSLPGALAGAAIVGIVQGMVPAIGLIPGVGGFATQVGAPQLVLTLLAFVVMALRGQRFSAGDVRDAVAIAAPPAAKKRSSGARLRRGAAVLHGRRAAIGIAAVALLAWPLLDPPFSWLGNAITACVYALIAASLVLLTGWVGQISLAQAAFVGIGAFTTAVVTNEIGLQFPLNLPFAAAAAAGSAALLGLVALRVRGLYLAVATLIFLWMANEYLFRSAWLVGAGGGSRIDTDAIGRDGAFPFFDFTERRTFYYVALAVTAAALWALSNLRDSKTGRAFFAVRGSETAAASLGVDVTRYKLLAFATSGLLAGVAGNLFIVGQGSVTATQFGFQTSLFYLAIAVVGGLSSLPGAVAAAVVFAAINELFLRVAAVAGWLDVITTGLLATVLLAYPGGLGALLALIPFPRAQRRASIAPLPVSGGAVGLIERDAAELAPNRDDRTPILTVRDATVRFGGLVALDGVSLQVREREIVGLIGPNGAGKTTLFNVISGLVEPTAGTVELFGTDATLLPVHRRAALGMARTFQVIQLFPQLSVFDNLLVATHAQNPTGALAHVAVTRPAFDAEQAARDRVAEIVAKLGLQDIAHLPVAGLPFGTLRMIELARALVTGAPLVILDEPASGLDNAETDALAELLREIRRELGVSILLIEHDVRMVTSVSDYVYVIDRGTPLADGAPSQVQRDPAVIAAYLGGAPD